MSERSHHGATPGCRHETTHGFLDVDVRFGHGHPLLLGLPLQADGHLLARRLRRLHCPKARHQFTLKLFGMVFNK